MPFSAAQATASAYQFSVRSVKATACVGAGLPAMRHRKVTICARVQVSFGLNVVGLVPSVTPSCTAQLMAVLNSSERPATSSNAGCTGSAFRIVSAIRAWLGTSGWELSTKARSLSGSVTGIKCPL